MCSKCKGSIEKTIYIYNMEYVYVYSLCFHSPLSLSSILSLFITIKIKKAWLFLFSFNFLLYTNWMWKYIKKQTSVGLSSSFRLLSLPYILSALRLAHAFVRSFSVHKTRIFITTISHARYVTFYFLSLHFLSTPHFDLLPPRLSSSFQWLFLVYFLLSFRSLLPFYT